ncbi:MAG: hypothetical protein J0I50_09560, partial [Microbacterium sp.]|nr:hypothetical protein [Microbacterium sp.]
AAPITDFPAPLGPITISRDTPSASARVVLPSVIGHASSELVTGIACTDDHLSAILHPRTVRSVPR